MLHVGCILFFQLHSLVRRIIVIVNLERNDVVTLQSFKLHELMWGSFNISCEATITIHVVQASGVWTYRKEKMFHVRYAFFLLAPSPRFDSLHIVPWISLLRIWHNLLENVSPIVCCMIVFSFWMLWVMKGKQFIVWNDV